MGMVEVRAAASGAAPMLCPPCSPPLYRHGQTLSPLQPSQTDCWEARNLSSPPCSPGLATTSTSERRALHETKESSPQINHQSCTNHLCVPWEAQNPPTFHWGTHWNETVITLFISAEYFGYPLSLEAHKDPGVISLLHGGYFISFCGERRGWTQTD